MNTASSRGRPLFVSCFALLIASSCASRSSRLHAETLLDDLPPALERSWIAPELWGNRLQDWRIANGRLECIQGAANKPLRTVHLLSHRLGETKGSCELSVRAGLIDAQASTSRGAAVGFLLGAGGPDVDIRAAALVHHSRGPGAGLFVGVDATLEAFVRDNEKITAARARPEGALPRRGWRVVHTDSVEGNDVGGKILDGDLGTIWHTEWKARKPRHPHEVQIDMGRETELGGVALIPRRDNIAGRIERYEIYVSNSRESWGEPAARGKLAGKSTVDKVWFTGPKRGRFVRLVALSAIQNRPSTTLAELWGLAPGAKPRSTEQQPEKTRRSNPLALRNLDLSLSLTPKGDRYEIDFVAVNHATKKEIAKLTTTVDANRLLGNVALVSHPGSGNKIGRFWFRDFEHGGSKLVKVEGQHAGPILSAQHTLSRGVLKMTAQLMPIGKSDPQVVELQKRVDGKWSSVAKAPVIVPGWTATFRVANWNAKETTSYRLVYGKHEFPGVVRADPVDKPVIAVAGFTGNHNTQRGVEGRRFDWKTGVWFPHEDLTAHVAQQRPDVLFFSGDQVYEGASPTGVDRANLHLDYLYKWYLWCWAYRDLTREIPSIIIPDDHDVYQGNLWGEGGRKTDKDDRGGYVYPAEFVKMVERTQTHNLPDPFDPTPVSQGIGVYYTGMTYGRISFAVIEDRKFKSGCNGRVPPSGSRRADHITDPDFDVRLADVDGVQLLGQRQLDFLRAWAQDWRGADMKLVVSQTVFGGLATHHGGGLQYLRADLDSNGWPQTGRRKALHEMRRGFAFHLAGDQHLATLARHGLDTWDDAGWSFAVPSVANFYPRKWYPKVPGKNREPGAPEYTGQHHDGLGNFLTIFAASNPGEKTGFEPAALHDRMPGYGVVRFDKRTRKIGVECWPRYADPSKPEHRQYPGWPRTVDQLDNYPRKAVAWLPTLKFSNVEDPVVQIVDESTKDIVYTLRIHGSKFQPKVFRAGRYTIRAGREGATKTLRGGVESADKAGATTIEIKL